uniref:Amino_oxidase domain-containing protein n=1 Tax=Heterorhabditis bacteriophora TaxID=37862 RepID=A0A1I7W6H0_HETBA
MRVRKIWKILKTLIHITLFIGDGFTSRSCYWRRSCWPVFCSSSLADKTYCQGPHNALIEWSMKAKFKLYFRLVIHHYGHGSNGITLGWGSAERAVSLIKETLFEEEAEAFKSGGII